MPLTATAIRSRSFDQLEIAHLASEGALVLRPTAEDRARWPFLACYALRGPGIVRSANRATRLEDGDFTVVPHAEPLELRADGDAELLVIRVPAATLGPQAGLMRAAEGRVWSTADGTASIVGHLLSGIAAQAADYVPTDPARLAQHIVGLMSLLCVDGAQAPDPHGRDRMLQRAKDYIEEHLGDPELTPDRIAAHENVSTRTLHRLFESEGLTVRGWIRSRRLEHCRVELADTSTAGLAVSAIGSRWGLWDAAHFSRLFKSAYGQSPRAYRASARAGLLRASA